MNTRTLLPALLATALLAIPFFGAQPAAAYTIKSEIIGSYTPEDAGYGSRRGRDLPAVIVGNPFPAPPEVVAQAISLGMRDGGRGPGMSGIDAARAPQRVIWQLGGGTLTGAEVCDRRNPLGLGTGGASGMVIATYCRGDSAMTQAYGTFDRVADPNDPAFINFIRQITVNLFPPQNPDFRGDHRRGRK